MECYGLILFYLLLFVGIVHTQEGNILGATIRGEVIEATPEQKPIVGVTVKIVNAATEEEFTVKTDNDGFYEKKGLPAGRYFVSVSKKGYGDRVGKAKVVAAGGEIFDRIRMRKKDNFLTFLFDNYIYIIVVVIIAFILIFTGVEF